MTPVTKGDRYAETYVARSSPAIGEAGRYRTETWTVPVRSETDRNGGTGDQEVPEFPLMASFARTSRAFSALRGWHRTSYRPATIWLAEVKSRRPCVMP